MGVLLGFARAVSRLTEAIGRLTYWLTLLMVLLGAFNAVARYQSRFTGLNLSSNRFIESQWYLFSLIFLLGAAYTLKHHGHVRVDVLYGRLSFRGKAWIDLAGNLLFLLPFCALMIYFTLPSVMNSWRVWEISPDPGGLPRYPIKTMVPVAFGLLFLQGIANTIEQLAVLKGLIEPPADEPILNEVS